MPKQPDNLIMISDWQKGIAQSGFVGFADMRNVNPYTIPGLLLQNPTAVKKTATTVTALPLWFVQNNDTNETVYTLDQGGKVYSASNAAGDTWQTWAQVAGNTVTSAHGNGMAIYKDYLFVARDTALDTYGPLSSSPAWTSAWQTMNSDTSTHAMWVGQDDILYIGGGVDTTNKLGSSVISVMQKAGKVFTPSDATTYTYTATALQLPYPYRIRCFEELGVNLMTGTYIGVALNGQNAAKVGDIFPWDRTSATFNLPIRLKEQGINQLKTVGNTLYIQAGQNGNFYNYNGYALNPFFRFPHNTTVKDQLTYYNTTMYPGAISYHRGGLFFGLSFGSSAGQSGVYSMNLDGSGLVMENTISTGNSTGNVSIGCLFALRDFNYDLLIGWQDSGASAQGIDLVGEDSLSTSYIAYSDSQIYNIGTVFSPNAQQQLEIYLDRPLASGDGVQIGYRTDMSQPFTPAWTFDFATYPNKRYINFGASAFLTQEQAQFRISLSGNPRIKYIRFI